ncbi:3936_t:CDS:2, partial [Entrophospora sp. SA101]
QVHLNAFVHPCLDSTLWNLVKVHYEYGEIPSKNHYNKNRADGIDFMTDADKFQLVYVEGSRPVVKQEKEIIDVKKIINNLKSIFSKIIKEIVKDRRLNEVDSASLPREFSEMQDFVYFYETVGQEVKTSFDEAKTKPRLSHFSYVNALLRLDEEEIDELQEEINKLYFSELISAMEFVNIGNKVSKEFSDAEIIETVCPSQNNEVAEDENEGIEPEPSIPVKSALEYSENILSFLKNPPLNFSYNLNTLSTFWKFHSQLFKFHLA